MCETLLAPTSLRYKTIYHILSNVDFTFTSMSSISTYNYDQNLHNNCEDCPNLTVVSFCLFIVCTCPCVGLILHSLFQWYPKLLSSFWICIFSFCLVQNSRKHYWFRQVVEFVGWTKKKGLPCPGGTEAILPSCTFLLEGF